MNKLRSIDIPNERDIVGLLRLLFLHRKQINCVLREFEAIHAE